MPTPNLGRRPGRTTPLVPAAGADTEPVERSTAQLHTEAGRPNPYPRRVTLDLSNEMYERLRTEAFRTGKRLSQLGREALDQYLPEI
jgi:hypothetical protein